MAHFSRPINMGGLGFGLKWDMGWMHDPLGYFAPDPIRRRFHHNQLTFRPTSAARTSSCRSRTTKWSTARARSAEMPGDLWQRFANLRLLYASMWAHPGKKLLFMGGEFGQCSEWTTTAARLGRAWRPGAPRSAPRCRGAQSPLRERAALHEHDVGLDGFEWIDGTTTQQRLHLPAPGHATPRGRAGGLNFTPVPRTAIGSASRVAASRARS